MTMRRNLQERLQERVLRSIRSQGLVPPAGRLVVAVSGGQDSVCLLYLLVRMREQLGVELHVAHLDHRLRGVESRADARYVAGLARRLGIPATVEERDVRAYHAAANVTLEEAAREVRYAFLAEVVRKEGASRVTVGHTRDDHVETVLMHILRGTGTAGLRGLLPVSRWHTTSGDITVVRPLLEVSRAETAEYCRRQRLRPRVDTSNFSLSPLRNRLRHHLLPVLREYNPRISGALVRIARIAGDDMAFLQQETDCHWNAVVRMERRAAVFDKQRLLELPPGLRRNLLRRALEEFLGSLMDVEARHIEEMLAVLDAPAGRRISLPAGLFFTVEYDRYLLSTDPAALCPFPVLKGEHDLNVPGVTEIPGWRVETAVDTGGQTRGGDLAVSLDATVVSGRITVRARRPGDRFQPLGMAEQKKLGEFMIDAHIPRSWRSRVPVVCSQGRIVWVVGWRIDDRAKATADTRKVLRIRFEHVPRCTDK